MFDNPLNLSYAMSEISHIASFQCQHSNYACPIKMHPSCTYGIDDELMVFGFCFSCDDIAMLPLHDLHNSSTMSCHDHIVLNMHCFGCCQYSPCDVSTNVHEETPIVSSYIVDLDAFHTLHNSHDSVHHMHSMNNNALNISHDALHNLSLHYAIHNNKPLMMDDMFLYHASHLFEQWIFCANRHMHVRIMMDDVYIYHAHTISPLPLFCVGTHIYSSTSQSQELTKRALESNDDLEFHGLSLPPFPSCIPFTWLSHGYGLYTASHFFLILPCSLCMLCLLLCLCHAIVTLACIYP